MWLNRRRLWIFLLLVVCIIIHLYSNNVQRVENGYSTGFFPVFSNILRHMFGWVPFSIGDILYALALAWLIFGFIKLLISAFKIRNFKRYKAALKGKAPAFLIGIALIYIVFNIFWGINYNRKGIAAQLGLRVALYTTNDLKELNCLLIDKVNSSKSVVLKNHEPYPTNAELKEGINNAYVRLAANYPYLAYRPLSFKPSLWGWLGNYLGFSGYYNPFTGEAQLNTTVPKFLLPYTSCHEVAHQVGYAKEMEANFVGYLAASNSTDTLFHYSVYLDLFLYANRNLYETDSSAAKVYRAELSMPVKSDIKEWSDFSKRHQNPVEPVIRYLYGKFLESNEQPQGILSYDEVTGFMIAYYKKYHRI